MMNWLNQTVGAPRWMALFFFGVMILVAAFAGCK